MFTKKHYELFASQIKYRITNTEEMPRKLMHVWMATQLTAIFAMDNSSFKPRLFLEACGIDESLIGSVHFLFK